MPKLRDDSIRSRLYSRRRGKTSPSRYYADFRDFDYVGGKQEPLAPPGSKRATTDEEEALELARRRLDELEGVAEKLPDRSVASERTLGSFVEKHLLLLAKARDAELREETRRIGEEPTPRKRRAWYQWQRAIQKHLERALLYFGEDRDLALITPGDIGRFVSFLQEYTTAQGRTLASGSIHQHLNSLSKLYRRAMSEELVADNPVSQIFERPKIQRQETPFLEVHEMTEILRYAFEDYDPVREDRAILYFPVILATLALTGAREQEIFGARVGDLDLDRQVLHIRENRHRTLKTENAPRPLNIPSQLVRILRQYLSGGQRPKGELLFPGENDAGNEAMIHDLRKAYDQMPMPEARLPGVALRSKMIRHTWCAARLQTLDKGAPVSTYTVAEEMGHKDTKMIKRIYGHLGRVRHRGEEVEFLF